MMRHLFLTFMACLTASAQPMAQPAPPAAVGNYAYLNGLWFNGSDFVPQPMYAVNGVFTSKAPASVDSVFDLGGGYVLPPLSETHTHLLEGVGNYQQTIGNYLAEGVFYVKNPNNIKPFTDKLRGLVNTPYSIDASFANGGLTSTGGHPELLYEDRLRAHLGPLLEGPAERGWFRNKSYFNIDSREALEQQWPLIKNGRPDFIKVYLANSEDLEQQAPVSRFPLRKGLSPVLVKAVVQRAHDDGYRVSAHVETRHDFVKALEAGVDEITHTPGFYLFSATETGRYRLLPEDAAQAARQGVFVVTSLLSRNLTEDASLMPLVEELQAYNLALLQRHGVRLVIGSDHANSPFEEVAALRKLGVFDDATILRMWCEESPLAIFPERKLGRLEEGYEASFLVLEGNPLEDWEHLRSIALRVKQGRVVR